MSLAVAFVPYASRSRGKGYEQTTYPTTACAGIWSGLVVRCEPLVSRLATFRLSIGWCAWACGALACVYVSECGGCRAGVRLNVAVCDTGRGVSLVVCGVGACAGCGG